MAEQDFGEPLVRSLTAEEAEHHLLDLSLPEGSGRPYVVTNFVQSVDGRTTILGRSAGIGSRFDRLLLHRLRAAAEGVLVGAATMRAENVPFLVAPHLLESRLRRGLPRAVVAAIVSATGDLPLFRPVFSTPTPDLVPVVLTTRLGAAILRPVLAPHVHLLTLGESSVDLTQALSLLYSDYGVRRLVVEGGARLIADLLAAELVDEVFLTVAPKLLGGPAGGMVAPGAILPRAPMSLTLRSAHAYGGELFLRYCVPRALG
ncbi:MAG: RibD family protein [Chloroflexota bacterium]